MTVVSRTSSPSPWSIQVGEVLTDGDLFKPPLKLGLAVIVNQQLFHLQIGITMLYFVSVVSLKVLTGIVVKV